MAETATQAQTSQQLLKQMIGGWITQGIHVAAELGIADLVAESPQTAEELARQTKTHGGSLYRVLRALATIGIFAEDADHRFSLTPLAESLRSDVPGSLRAFGIMLGAEFYQSWGELLYSVQTGKPGFEKRFGVPFFQYMTEHPERHTIYDAAMMVHGIAETEPMLDAYDFSAFGTVVDIGGGQGCMLAAILNRHPEIEGILFDLPAVVDRSRSIISDLGLSERCRLVGGDFFTSVPAADAYVLRHIIHDWDDKDAVTILRNCRNAMNPGGRVLVVETVIPPLNEPCFGKWLDLMMLIGGGFHRYSTDAQWLVPHFEKMLYDQALLSKVYLQAYQVTGKEHYAQVAREIFDYVLRDMTDPAGGFYAAEDADSEGHEGTFYLWEPQQIASVLNQDEARLSNAYFGVTEHGNFEGNKTILSVVIPTETLAKEFHTDCVSVANTLAIARAKIFAARARRTKPQCDDKVIAGWNGLMISSLAYGGAALQEKKYLDAAVRCADFVLSTLRTNDRLRRYYRDGQVVGNAFLDDYAFMTMGLMDLYEATFETKWLVAAKKLSEEMIELFAPAPVFLQEYAEGGFFLAGRDDERLIARTKPASDGAIPSGNSAAALTLLKLGRLTMNEQFTQQGAKTLEAFSRQLEKSPVYSSLMLEALSFQLGPVREIVIAGAADAADTRRMFELICSKFLPNVVVLLHDEGKSDSALYEIAPFIKNQIAVGGKTTAYVCENYACTKPVNDICEFESLLARRPDSRQETRGQE